MEPYWIPRREVAPVDPLAQYYIDQPKVIGRAEWPSDIGYDRVEPDTMRVQRDEYLTPVDYGLGAMQSADYFVGQPVREGLAGYAEAQKQGKFLPPAYGLASFFKSFGKHPSEAVTGKDIALQSGASDKTLSDLSDRFSGSLANVSFADVAGLGIDMGAELPLGAMGGLAGLGKKVFHGSPHRFNAERLGRTKKLKQLKDESFELLKGDRVRETFPSASTTDEFIKLDKRLTKDQQSKILTGLGKKDIKLPEVKNVEPKFMRSGEQSGWMVEFKNGDEYWITDANMTLRPDLDVSPESAVKIAQENLYQTKFDKATKGLFPIEYGEIRGDDAIMALAKRYGSPQEAVNKLRQWGISGVEYPAGKGLSSLKEIPGLPSSKGQGSPHRVASHFSGTGTLESGLGEGFKSVHAVEYQPEIIEQFNKIHSTKYKPRNINDVSPQEIIESKPDIYHASPVCKNFSKAKSVRGADVLDKKSAESVSKVIREAQPPVVTVENVPAYRETALFDMITKELDNAGYNWDVNIIDAAEYGGNQTRKRMILRAVKDGELPPLPEKTGPTDWYNSVKDLIDDAEDTIVPAWEIKRLRSMVQKGILDPNKPIITMGGSVGKSVASARNAGMPAPTLKATPNEVPRLILPDGRQKRVSPQMMSRLMGLPDNPNIPQSHKLAKTVLGNGIHGEISRQIIKPLLSR